MSASTTIRVDDSLYLKQLEPPMAGELLTLVDTNRAHLREWLGWVDRTATENDMLRFIEFTRTLLSRGSLTLAMVFEGKIVGVVGHQAIDVDQRAVPIGYWVGRSHQGRGLIRRAVGALIEHTFRELKLDKVLIRTAVGNARSKTIPRSLGFKFHQDVPKGETVNGVHNDLNEFIMTAEDWSQGGCSVFLES